MASLPSSGGALLSRRLNEGPLFFISLTHDPVSTYMVFQESRVAKEDLRKTTLSPRFFFFFCFERLSRVEMKAKTVSARRKRERIGNNRKRTKQSKQSGRNLTCNATTGTKTKERE